MSISAIPGLVPAVQPQQTNVAQKPIVAQPAKPMAAADSDGDNDGSGGVSAKGIVA